jgi:NAD(P)-dependent dehydrogenase (short-subunit alcohol dehydrogenase family)
MSEAKPVAVVTGGSRGIGRAIVESLASREHRVVFCGRSEESVGEAERELRRAWGDRVRGETVDVRDRRQVERFVQGVVGEGEGLDVLVNNAGIGRFAPIDELSPEAWDETMATNLSGVFYCMRAVVPAMKEGGGGWIINIASLASRNPFAGGAAYNASKYGLLGLSEAAMLDLRGDGIRVTAVLPGSVDTGFRSGSGGDWKLQPEDVARAVTDLLAYPAHALPSRIELRPTRTGS